MTTHSNGFTVIGAIEVKWLATGGEGGFLGKPLENEQPADNSSDTLGRTQRFTGGVIAWHPQIGTAYEMHGAILARWHDVGEVRFAFPITDETTTPDTQGRFNHFRTVHAPGKPDSSIYWHPDTGAHVVSGAFRDKWASIGWEKSVVGYPTGSVEPVLRDVIRRGAVQPFQRGFIAWHPSLGAGSDGAHEVHGAIAARWNALGRTAFGFPITDELTPMETVGIFEVPSRGRYNHFRVLNPGPDAGRECSIYWHPEVAGGAHEVCPPIRDKWASMGWEKSVVGYPTGPPEPVHGGIVQSFQRGFIGWHPSIGDAHEVHGAIATRWNELGHADYGFPITDELSTPGETVGIFTFPSLGRYNHFRAVHLAGAPDRSIYWHPDVAGGAHEIYGDIRTKWASLGWERSKLGYPISGERDRRGAGRIQDFQNGAIAWAPTPGAWVDWFRFRRLITTPSGSALGGWAELEVHQNGHAFFRGYLRNSSDIVDYKFIIRATLDVPPAPTTTPPGLGQTYLFQKAGEVENAFEWFDAGYHEQLRNSWAEVERSTVGIAKSYEKTGLIDDLGQLMLDSISFVIFAATLGGPVASALLVTKGLSSVTKTPIGPLGGDFGLLAVAGASLLLGPTFAFPVFIGTLVVTSLLYDQREITSEEYEFAKIVFGETLPPRENIILTNMNGAEGRGFAIPAMDGRSMLVNITDDAYSFAGGPMRFTSKAYPIPGQLLIHELVHAWQFYQMNRFIPGYLCRGLGVQLFGGKSSYDPPAPGSKWGKDFGLEQEAATVDRWFQQFAIQRNAMGAPTTNPPTPWANFTELRNMLNSQWARQDPYFRYIENNIRLGEDDHD